MKKLILAVIAFASFSGVSLAQAVSAKKVDTHKMQVVKNSSSKKTDAKIVAIPKASTVAVKVPPAAARPVIVSKPAVVVKTNSAVPLKKDGTPDKRFKATPGRAAGPLKKDGTPDMRYKTNKKP